jgi:hypothetical protein
MKTINNTESIDAVKMMRDSREKISKETQHMSFKALKLYIQQKLSKSTHPKIGTKKM